uniref:Uncharacterized protein n=1 Tax=Rhizophora mucronata TaxID=61149 RepID=A0A2P2R3I1_RHIMU
MLPLQLQEQRHTFPVLKSENLFAHNANYAPFSISGLNQ